MKWKGQDYENEKKNTSKGKIYYGVYLIPGDRVINNLLDGIKSWIPKHDGGVTMTDWFLQGMTLEQADRLFENGFEITYHNGIIIANEKSTADTIDIEKNSTL